MSHLTLQERRRSRLMNSCPSLARSRKRKMKAPLKTSLSAWNSTTSPTTEPWSSPSSSTSLWLWVKDQLVSFDRRTFLISKCFVIGERLEEKEVDDILAACCDPEDDDGMIPYKRELFQFSYKDIYLFTDFLNFEFLNWIFLQVIIAVHNNNFDTSIY